jgi:hypothetical protein
MYCTKHVPCRLNTSRKASSLSIFANREQAYDTQDDSTAGSESRYEIRAFSVDMRISVTGYKKMSLCEVCIGPG